MHAVLQSDLRPLEAERLRRAFRVVPGLTAHAADILGRDAFGVLVKNLSQADAITMQGALRAEGIATDVVVQSLLPALPQARLVKRLEPRSEHLLIFDPLGRAIPLEWQHVYLVAAGAVRVTEFKRRQTTRPVPQLRGDGFVSVQMEADVSTREEMNERLLGELLVAGGALRYSFDADKFDYTGLGERRSGDISRDFTSLIRELCGHASHAGLNRGASGLRDGTPAIFHYPSKNAFHEEIIWMLWQAKKSS